MKARNETPGLRGAVAPLCGARPMSAQACSSYERLAPSFTHAFALKLYW
jgi:hypothetical protein